MLPKVCVTDPPYFKLAAGLHQGSGHHEHRDWTGSGGQVLMRMSSENGVSS